MSARRVAPRVVVLSLLATTLAAMWALVGAHTPASATPPSTHVSAAASAAPTNVCTGKLKAFCDGGKKVANTACNLSLACTATKKEAHAAKKAAEIAADPSGALKDWVTANGPEAWAKDAATGSASLLQKIQSKLLTATKPHLMTRWISVRYGTAWLLGIILAAFAQTRAIAGMASATPEAREAVRDATTWSFGYMALVTVTPVILSSLVDLSWTLARQMGEAAKADQSAAITHYIHMLNGIKDPNTQITGGVISLLLFAGLIFIGAATALIELTIGEYGFYLLAIIFPMVAGLAVFPKWRKPLWITLGGLIGFMLTPPLLFLAYWVVWGGAAHTSGVLSTFTYMAVVGLIAAMAPILLMFLLPMFAPTGSGAAAAAATHVRQVGSLSGRVASRQSRRLVDGRRNGGRGGGGSNTSSNRSSSRGNQQNQSQQQNGQNQQPQPQQKQAPTERANQHSQNQQPPGPTTPPPSSGGGARRGGAGPQSGQSPNQQGGGRQSPNGPDEGPGERRGRDEGTR